MPIDDRTVIQKIGAKCDGIGLVGGRIPFRWPWNHLYIHPDFAGQILEVGRRLEKKQRNPEPNCEASLKRSVKLIQTGRALIDA